MKSLVLRLAVFTALLVSFDHALAWYGRRSFLSERKIHAALARDEGGLLFVGDSRTVAALSFNVMEERLKQAGTPIRLVDLTLNSTGIEWHSLAARQIVRAAPKTRGVVLGFAMNRMLRRDLPVDPDLWVGFNSTFYSLIHPDDLDRLYPGGPLARLDLKLKYYLGHFSSLYRYRSILQYRSDQFRARIINGERKKKGYNAFGRIADMEQDGKFVRSSSRELLLVHKTADGWSMNPWFEHLRSELRRRGIPLYVVELTVNGADRLSVADSPEGLAFRTWLSREIDSGGGHFFDMSHVPGISDADFPDTIHMDKPASIRFSTAFGDELASYFRRHPDLVNR
ncbi:MAG: hypothetical protein JWN86_4389 [Planctomycetota bacterium]|nr:hypothetical protein [Planctomycetota bacterium]